MGKFSFNGKTSEDFGLVVQTPPTYEYPERDLTVAHVPGRNGDIIIDNQCYKNVQRTYSVGLKYYQSSGYYVSFEGILNWLNSANGKYVRLEDTYDSEVYRLASFQMNGNFTDYFGQGGATTITFECKPQRFLKIGEKEHKYVGNIAEINNDSNYVAKPYITIKGIGTNLDTVLMFSVFEFSDNHRKSKSNIVISNYIGNMVFDSEEEVVTTTNEYYDLGDKVNLNGTEFPKLYPGRNQLVMNSYLIESTTVNAYSTILATSQSVCNSEYKTYAALEQTAQEKIFVKSYKALTKSKQESYAANSVQSFISSIAETYTFESYNTLLSDYGEQYVFTGTASENSSTKPTWLNMSDSTDGITVTAAVTGFFLVSGKHKKIMFVASGTSLIGSDKLNPNSVNTITYFAAVTNPDNIYGSITPQAGGVNYGMQITYTDMPRDNNNLLTWLNFRIEYDSDYSPVKIHYIKKAKGYYWTDKSWIFGKAQWKYYPDSTEYVMASLNWNTSKKAFVNSSGLSLSTTSTFTYKYLDATPTTLPDYPILSTTTVDDRGVETTTIDHDVHFSIVDLGNNSEYSLSNICIKAKDDGYYSYQVETGDQSNWLTLSGDGTIIGSISGTKTFGIFYLGSIPDYSNEEDWPEWLDPVPLTSAINLLVAEHIYFRVLKTSKYRVSAGSEDDTPQRNAWVSKTSGQTLSDIMSSKTVDDAMYVYQLENIPQQFDYNRSYTVNAGASSSTPPEWLSATILPAGTSTSEIPEKIKYSARLSGYFKWDANESWVYYNANDELFEIGGKDDCVIYYLASLPAYSASDFQKQSMFSLFDITVVQSPNPGNPKEIEFKIADGASGYYRANNSTAWKFLNSGETLLTSKIGDGVYLYHLTPSGADLSDLEIIIKPRWWKL